MSADVEYPPERTALALVNGIIVDLERLVEQQMQLTRREIEREVRKRSSAAVVFALGAGVLFLGAIMCCQTVALLMHWLASPLETDLAWLPLWACHAVVTGVLAMIGGILIYAGRAKFKSMSPPQHLAIEDLQENVPWTTNRK